MKITINIPLAGWHASEVKDSSLGYIVNCKPNKGREYLCPICGKRMRRRSTRQVAVRDLPIQRAACTLNIDVPVCKCDECGKFYTVRPAEVHPTIGVTWRLMTLLSLLYQDCPISKLVGIFRLAPTTIRRMVHGMLTQCHEVMPVDLDNRSKLIIDEKYLGPSINFITSIIDGDTGEVLYLARGKGVEDIAPFFESMSEEQRNQIEVVSIDRSNAYKSAVERYLPHAAISYDPFHLICNVNDALDKVRREQWRKADAENKKFIKGTRYVLLRGGETLKESAQKTLEELKAVNEPISTAHLLKEQFRDIFKQEPDATQAHGMLVDWVRVCMASNIVPFQKIAKSISKSMNTILNFFRYRLASGRIEGLNSKIARLSHKMRGIINTDFLFLLLRQQTCPLFARLIS